MNMFINIVVWLLDMLIPRFVDEVCAINIDLIDYSAKDTIPLYLVEPGEQFDFIVTIRSFNLFGFGLFPKQIGELAAFTNPHDVI